MNRNMRFFLLTASVLLGAVLSGCGGSGGLGTGELIKPVQPVQTGPTQLPAFPLNDQPGALRITSAQDNIQLGKNAADTSDSGATPDGDNLLLDSEPGTVAWGIWRWGEFGDTILPESLRVEAIPVGSGEYWLLLSNYDTTTWDIIGPLKDTLYSMAYDLGTDFTSPGGYTYVALITTGGDDLTVEKLNLRSSADVNPPLAPHGLTLDSVSATEAEISWSLNSEPDMDGFRIYSNTEVEEFAVDDPDTVFHGEVSDMTDYYTLRDLTPETTYYIRISAFDVVGNESPLSDGVTALTPASGEMAPPTGLTADALGSSWVDLSWTEPADPDPLGYDFYTGPDEDFLIGDPGVTKRNTTGLVSGDNWRMDGLTGETEYFVKARAYYLGGKYSPLSEALNFATLASSPPVPAFNISPQIVQAGKEAWFNASQTTDEDTDVSELTFSWDFENDGVVDIQTTGPELVNHIYVDRGPVTAKLTVSDGTPVPLTKDFVVTFGFDYYKPGASAGDKATVKAIDTDPATGRIAVLSVQGMQTGFLKYYNGTTWQNLDMSLVNGVTYQDVALISNGVVVLTHQVEPTLSWILYKWDGSSWSSIYKLDVSASGIDAGEVAAAPNGLISIELLAFDVVGQNTNFKLATWHQKADETWATDTQTGLGTNEREQISAERSNTTSYFVYTRSGNVNLWTYTDSSDTQSVAQTYTGKNLHLSTGKDPGDMSHVYWGASTDGNRVYYGDNYGTANGGSQYYTTASNANSILGVGLAGDNEGLFCWCEEEADGLQHLYMYDTTANAGAGQLYDVASDYGVALDGKGAYLDDSGTPGVYAAATESRDGESTGRHIVAGTAIVTDTLYEPTGGAHVGAYHQSLGFTDGSIRFLQEQLFPTAINTYAAFAGDTFAVSEAGSDNWLIPNAACVTAVAGEYFVGSFSSSSPKELLLYRFSGSNETGVLEQTLPEMGSPQLAFNSAASEVALFGLTGNGTDMDFWTWDGSSWSAGTTIYTGTAIIEAYKAAAKSDGEWGLAFLDDAENVRLMETSAGVWGSAQVLTTDEVNGPSGIGLAYHADGHTSIVVERRGADPGLFIGVKPNAGTFSWEEAVDTTGTKLRSLYTFYHEAAPVVLYYWRNNPASASRLNIAEEFANVWETVEFDFQMHGAPISAVLDANDNIILCGYTLTDDPHRAAVAIIYN